MVYNIGSSRAKDVAACVAEATSKFNNPKLILFFSPVEHFAEYAALIHEKFPDSISMGATTIASFSHIDAEKDVLKVMGFENGISCSADVLEDVDKYPVKYIGRVKDCVQKVGNKKNTICLEFTTGLLCAEESVLAALNAALFKDHIPVFGGTAGDTGTATGTMVALNGSVRDRSTVFAIIHNEGGQIKIFRENIYTPVTGNILTVTRADSQTRTVYEYNHQPVAKVLSEEWGIPESQISTYLDSHPMGRLVGDEMFITANCAPTNNRGMTYHARMYDSSKVLALEPGNYKEIIAQTKAKIHAAIPRPSFSIMCHCLARTILFDSEGYLSEYAKDMGTVLGNYIGFSGYGEQSGEEHFNQTMTVAVFE